MTATIQLRPMRPGELFREATRFYQDNFLQFIGIIACVQIPLSLLTWVFSSLVTKGATNWRITPTTQVADIPGMMGAGFWLGLAGTILMIIVDFVLVQGVATAALTRSIADHYLGKSTGFVPAYRSIKNLWKRLIGTILVAGLYSIPLALWAIIPCAGWFTGPGILMFWSHAVLPLLAPIVVLEEKKASHAIRRAWDLTRRRFWWVVGFVGSLYLFNQFTIVAGCNMLTDQISQIPAKSVITSVVSLIANLLYLPLELISMTLMYFDLRVRTEDFDLSLPIQNPSKDRRPAGPGSGEGTIDATMIAQAPPPEATNLVTGKEMGYFVLLSLAVIALGLVQGHIEAGVE